MLKSRLLKLSFFYSCMNVVSAMAPFALMVILTRSLSPAEYGIWLLFVSLTSFVRPVLGLTLQDAVRMRYFTLSRESVSQFVISAIWISTILASLALPFAHLASDALSKLLKFPGEWLWSVILVSYLYGLFCNAQALFQFDENKRGFAILQIILTSCTVLFVAGFVFFEFGWKGPILATALSLCIAIFYSIYALRKELNLHPFSDFSVELSKELLLFGLRYLPTGLSLVVIPLTDRLFVAHMVSVAETSYLGIGQMFAFTFLLLSSGFHFAWQPKLFSALTQGGSSRIDSAFHGTKIFYLLLPVAAGTLLITALVSAHYIVGESFSSAREYIVWMFFAVSVQAIFQHNQAYLHCTGRVVLMSLWSLIAIATNPILNYYLIGMFGGIGVAIATSVSYGICALCAGISAILILRPLRDGVGIQTAVKNPLS